MRLEKRKPSGREKDEEALKLLAKLREQLYSSNISIVRQSAFNLSWMQEDGLDILTEALFGNSPRRTKGAAAYGLRKMRGRMRKQAEETLIEGLKHPDSKTAEICGNALIVLKRGKRTGKPGRPAKARNTKFQIREIPNKGRQKRAGSPARRPDDRPSRRR
ncbi:MAG: hypothetical protein RBS72_16575 [Sedimentisphaerales bacterium]|jgi:hypothetical protein|nr:hypothetical protein [Sedimentisphaerales bacterium]NLZ06605.1 hypothetical protein [Phycisphaerae bacterium]HNY79249.1 hypothetical protein [Sedimentisphaerales bacterium]HOC61537.1 hypothetical protein [Sedimentisphaerales bacterium]HOH65199.1 hypothetical protein [Sedimentisphaerales bacterium]